MAAAVAIASSSHGEGDAHSRAVAAHAALARLCRGGSGGSKSSGNSAATAAPELWRSRCAEAFPWSHHFGGSKSLPAPEPSLHARVQELMKAVPAPRAPDLSTLSLADNGKGGKKK